MADSSFEQSFKWKASSLIFSPKYKKLELNSEIPTYSVGFLGKCQIESPDEIKNEEYRMGLIANICKQIRQEKRRPKKVELSISWHGIEIVHMKTGKEDLLPIYLINRGMTDMRKPRIFAFIAENVEIKELECYAFVSTKPETSWAMTLCLKRAFEVAYDAWKTEQKKRGKFYDDKLLDLAEDLLKVNSSEHENMASSVSSTRGQKIDKLDYAPRTTWTKFEEDLMESSSSRFSLRKNKSSFRRMPSVREIVGQPAVDTMFRQRQKMMKCASVFDVGDNEGLRKAVQDEEVMILSVTGMDKKQKEKDDIGGHVGDMIMFE